MGEVAPSLHKVLYNVLHLVLIHNRLLVKIGTIILICPRIVFHLLDMLKSKKRVYNNDYCEVDNIN